MQFETMCFVATKMGLFDREVMVSPAVFVMGEISENYFSE